MTAATDSLRFRALRVEPRRLWIRYRPVFWPGAPAAWIDLARLGLGRGGGPAPDLPEPDELARLDGLVYLPPVASASEPWRQRLAARLVDAGVPCLWQTVAGGEREAAAPRGCQTVWDPTAALLSEPPERWTPVPRGALVVWPWVAGFTDRERLWRPGLDRLAEAGAARVLPLPLELVPRERRRLAELAPAADYAELFHRPPRPTTDFARAAHRRGLAPIWERPVPAEPSRRGVTRGAAGHLALVGELELATGGSEVAAQAFFRAARRLEEEPHDLEGLLREGNLGVLAWLEGPPREAVVQYLGERTSSALEVRLAAYVGEEPGPDRGGR